MPETFRFRNYSEIVICPELLANTSSPWIFGASWSSRICGGQRLHFQRDEAYYSVVPWILDAETWNPICMGTKSPNCRVSCLLFLPWKWKMAIFERWLLLEGPIFDFHDCWRKCSLNLITLYLSINLSTLPETNTSHLPGCAIPKGNFQPSTFRCFCC